MKMKVENPTTTINHPEEQDNFYEEVEKFTDKIKSK